MVPDSRSPCPPLNVSVYLELGCCVWHKNLLGLFVCCHLKISDEVSVGLHLGQLCQLSTKSPTLELKGRKTGYPRRSDESLALLKLCVVPADFAFFTSIFLCWTGCQWAYRLKRAVLWASTQSILVCLRWGSWVTRLFGPERIHKPRFVKEVTFQNSLQMDSIITWSW